MSSSSILVQRCLTASQANSSLISPPGQPTKTQELLHIYRRRVEMDKTQSVPVIDGGDQLLEALYQEQDERIITYGIESQKEHYVIFTDIDSTRLVGLISVQKII